MQICTVRGKQRGRGIKAKTVLIVGESHHSKARKGFPKTFTCDVIELDAIQRHRRSFRYFTILQRLLGSEDVWRELGRRQFWNSVSFYNYVQAMLNGSRKCPTDRQWSTGKTPFPEVVRRVKPDVLVVTGKRLWKELTKHFPAEPMRRDGLYTLSVNRRLQLPVAQIVHPASSAFSYDVEEPKIDALFRMRNGRK